MINPSTKKQGRMTTEPHTMRDTKRIANNPITLDSIGRFFMLTSLTISLFLDSKTVAAILNTPMKSVVLDPNEMTCTKKTQGTGGGKVCKIDSERYMLKANEQIPGQIFNPSMTDGYNNLQLFRRFGVVTPDVNFVFEPNGHYVMDGYPKVAAEAYIASRFIDDFVPASDLTKKATVHYAKNSRKHGATFSITKENYLRSEIVRSIGGEKGLAQLAVVGTLAHDIMGNHGNWGSQNGHLVVIDADLSPQTRKEYLMLARKMPNDIGMRLSLTTLHEMKAIYLTLLRHAESDVQFSILSLSDYMRLMMNYIDVCNHAISAVNAADERTRGEPSFINTALSRAFQEIAVTKSDIIDPTSEIRPAA